MITASEAINMSEKAAINPRIEEFQRKMDKAIKKAAQDGLRAIRWKGSYHKWADLNRLLRDLYTNNGFGFRLEQDGSDIYEVIYW